MLSLTIGANTPPVHNSAPCQLQRNNYTCFSVQFDPILVPPATVNRKVQKKVSNVLFGCAVWVVKCMNVWFPPGISSFEVLVNRHCQQDTCLLLLSNVSTYIHHSQFVTSNLSTLGCLLIYFMIDLLPDNNMIDFTIVSLKRFDYCLIKTARDSTWCISVSLFLCSMLSCKDVSASGLWGEQKNVAGALWLFQKFSVPN